jgi:ferredoxin
VVLTWHRERVRCRACGACRVSCVVSCATQRRLRRAS